MLTDTDDTNGAWTVVSNVKCLAEGVDVPTLDGIVVCEPRSSAVDVVQMVGRAIRPNTARDEPSVILLPVYLVPGEDPVQVVARSDFSGVVQTMMAMRDMDQTLDTYFADAAEPWEVTYQKVADHTTETVSLPSPDDNDPDTARLGQWCVRQAVAVDFDTSTPPGKRRLTGPQTAKVLALPGFAAVDTTEVDWTGRRRTNTDGRPPIDFDLPDGVGGEVAAQLAEAIHLHVVEALTDSYETGVAHLRFYVAREEHANVPHGSVTDDGFKLGRWVDTRRKDHKIGRLSTAKIAELDALGMVWNPLDTGYRIGVAHLRAYVAREGHANVHLRSVTDDGFKLGTWVSNRRRDHKVGRLTSAKIAELSALGMTWDPIDAGYRTGVDHLRSYIAREGHANVPTRHITDDDFTLGGWVNNRRSNRRTGTLSAARIAELNALGMVWDPYDAGYQIGMAHLRVYIAREGHANVPTKYVTDDGFTIGKWVTNRRKDRTIGRLSTAKIAELDALGMVWDPLDAQYQTGVAHLQAYAAAEGHARVPFDHIADDGFRLGGWAVKRREDRRVGRLSTGRVAELSALGVVWSPSRETGYRIGVDHLRVYIAREGHATVPVNHISDDGFTLGNWVLRRRKDRRIGRLSKAKITELSALGMVWNPRAA